MFRAVFTFVEASSKKRAVPVPGAGGAGCRRSRQPAGKVGRRRFLAAGGASPGTRRMPAAILSMRARLHQPSVENRRGTAGSNSELVGIGAHARLKFLS